MWNNQKQEKLLSLMSNLQTYYHVKQNFQKVDQHTGVKWLMNLSYKKITMIHEI